jgi:hypothetical protein
MKRHYTALPWKGFFPISTSTHLHPGHIRIRILFAVLKGASLFLLSFVRTCFALCASLSWPTTPTGCFAHAICSRKGLFHELILRPTSKSTVRIYDG